MMPLVCRVKQISISCLCPFSLKDERSCNSGCTSNPPLSNIDTRVVKLVPGGTKSVFSNLLNRTKLVYLWWNRKNFRCILSGLTCGNSMHSVMLLESTENSPEFFTSLQGKQWGHGVDPTNVWIYESIPATTWRALSSQDICSFCFSMSAVADRLKLNCIFLPSQNSHQHFSSDVSKSGQTFDWHWD